MQGIIDIAVAGAKLVREADRGDCSGTNFRYEYSRNPFSGTAEVLAVDITIRFVNTQHPTKSIGYSQSAEHG